MNALFKRTRVFVLLIVFIGLLLYVKGLTNGFIGDDYLQIVNNINVHSVINIPSFFTGSTYENGGADFITGIFYRPLMMTIFSVIYFATSNNPMMFHFIQLLFHIANTVLLFLFLRRFFPNPTSFFISTIFLVHPINSESVLYSANLQEVLFFFFGMIAILLTSKKDSTKFSLYLASLMILLSLFSKESGILFIFVIFAYAFLFDKNRQRFKFLLTSLTSVFGVYLFFRYAIAHMFSANNSLAPITHATLIGRAINMPAIIFYYLRLFFFPKDMNSYQFWFIKSMSVVNFWLPFLIITAFTFLLLAGFVWTFRKHKKNIKIYLFFMLWFSAGLALHIQILPLDATVADRWFYFPIVGILGIFAIIFTQTNLIRIKPLSKLFIPAITLVIVILSLRTFIRISDWQNNLTLLSHDVTSPSDFISENALAAALIEDGQFEKAKPHVKASINTHPFSVNLNNLAIIYAAEKNNTKAKQYFEKATSAGQNLTVYENYANYLLYFDNPKQALQFSQKAIKIYPRSAKLFLVLAQAEYLDNNKTQALNDALNSYRIQADAKTADIILMIKANKPLSLQK